MWRFYTVYFHFNSLEELTLSFILDSFNQSLQTVLLSSTLIDRVRQQLRLPSTFVPEGILPESEPRLIALQLNIQSNSSTEISFSVGKKKSVTGKNMFTKPHTKSEFRKFSNALNFFM